MLNCLAGVDEAGLGPILGPLVVAGVAMTGPEGTDPWLRLQGLVTRHRHQKGKIRVADSKKVKQGPHGLRRLEETALTFWGARHGELPESLSDWLEQLGCDLEGLRRCPWYGEFDLSLPIASDRDWIELQSELLLRKLRGAELELLHIAVRPVDVEEWNRLIADTDNKSRAHFHAYSEVIARLLAVLPGKAHLVADRCGGRMHYRSGLQRNCPGYRVEVISEDEGVSVYRLTGKGEPVTLTFTERGEDRSFPTALSSCFAKYLRELMIAQLNRWFCGRIPGLKPTAGYYTDGHRFLQDVDAHVQECKLPISRLVRIR